VISYKFYFKISTALQDQNCHMLDTLLDD